MRTVAVLLPLLVLLPRPGGAADSVAELPDELDEHAEGVLQARLDDVLPASTTARLRLLAPAAGGLRVLQRLTAAAPTWRLAALAERDPGEGRWHDHASAYLEHRPRRGVAVTVGRLRPAFGQGLLFARGGSLGIPSGRPDTDGELLGTHSSSEARALTGVALGLRRRATGLTVVAGRLRWDARVDDGVAVSLPESGDHSGTGAATRQRLSGTVAGLRWTGAWHQGGGAVHWGVTVQRLAFGRALDLRRADEGYAFHGRAQAAVAVDLVAALAGGQLWGGAARLGARHAVAAGLSKLDIAGVRADVALRRADAGVFAPLGGAPATDDGERGLTAHLRRRRLRAWLDVVQHGDGRYRHPVPQTIRRLGIRWEPRPARHWRLRWEAKGRDGQVWSAGAAGRSTTMQGRGQVRWERDGLRLEAGVDAVRVGERHVGQAPAVTTGWVASVAAGLRGDRGRVELQGSRVATDGYAARIYAYERELPGAVSIRPLYGRGWRSVIVTGLRIGPLTATVRWRLEARDDRLRPTLSGQIDLERDRPAAAGKPRRALPAAR